MKIANLNPGEREDLIRTVAIEGHPSYGFPGDSDVKNLPAMQETWVWSLDREDPLEKEMATCSSIIPGKSHRQRSLMGYIHGVTKSQMQLSD